MTTARPSYSDLLRDPRWQRKRLETLQAADFACEKCGAKDKTLNVHHRAYKKGAKPWEYERGELQSLCEACHETIHDFVTSFTLLCSVLNPLDLAVATGFMKAMAIKQIGGELPFTAYELIGAAILAKGGYTCEAVGKKLSDAVQESGKLSAEVFGVHVEGRPN